MNFYFRSVAYLFFDIIAVLRGIFCVVVVGGGVVAVAVAGVVGAVAVRSFIFFRTDVRTPNSDIVSLHLGYALRVGHFSCQFPPSTPCDFVTRNLCEPHSRQREPTYTMYMGYSEDTERAGQEIECLGIQSLC